MLVLIDESGCAGFKFGEGSTSYFVVAMVIFRSFEEAEKTSKTIAEIRERLKIRPEFRFRKCRDNIRDVFFESVAKHEFVVRALVVDKRRIHETLLRSGSDNFYSYFMRLLIQHDYGILQAASVKIDGRADRQLKRSLSTYLRSQISAGKIRKVGFADSKRDNLIQLADMVVGAIARSYRRDRPDCHRWRQMLAPKIDNVWEYN